MDNSQNDMLSKLLSDPKNLAALASVAKNFMNTANNTNETSKEIVADNNQTDNTVSNAAAATITASEVPQQIPSHFTDRENLLLSIKPYLKAERQPKVDSLLKALNIAKIISTYTGNNLQ